MDDSETRAALEQARELARTIDSEALQALASEAAGRVARWRWADASSTVHWPDPWQQVRRTEGGSGGWRSSGGILVHRVGLDGDGRPLVVERRFNAEREFVEVWHHDERGSWMVHDLIGDTLAHVYRGPWERVELIASSRLEGFLVGAERWTWKGDVAVRGVAAEVEVDDAAEAFGREPVARAYEADVDAGGALRRFRQGERQGEVGPLPGGGIDAVIDTLTAASGLDCDDEVWRAELHRSEPLGETAALVEALATGLEAAIRTAAVTAAVERPFLVEHHIGELYAERAMALPGFVRVGSERFRDRTRALSSGDRMALYELSHGEASGEVVRLELAPLCDADTLRGCRALNTALCREEDHADHARGWSALDALGVRLLAALDARPPLAATADPFLTLVDLDPHFHHDGLRRAVAVLGRERVEAFLDSLASEVRNGGADAVDLDAARRDPAVIEAWARERGLGEQAAAIAAAARPAFRLERASDGILVQSRVGGSGLLAPGTAWPRSSYGDPLSFLAAIDLAELPPPLPGTDALPDDGWLLFFAALDWEDGRQAFEGAPTPNEDGALARVFRVPAGERPVPAEPPADLSRAPDVLLRERRVVATAQLTLEDGYDSARDFGLDELQTEVYDELAQGLQHGLPLTRSGEPWEGPSSWDDWGSDDVYDDDPEPDDGLDADDLDDGRGQVGDDVLTTGAIVDVEGFISPRAESPDFEGSGDVDVPLCDPDAGSDWILGALTAGYGHKPEAGTVLLLQLSSPGFSGSGTIEFRMPEAALAACDWSQVVASE